MLIKASCYRCSAEIIFHSSSLQMSSWYFCWYLLYTTFILSFCEEACPDWAWLQDVLWLFCLLLLWLCFLLLAHVVQSCSKTRCCILKSAEYKDDSLPSHPPSNPACLLYYKALTLSCYWLLLIPSLINST